MSTSVNLNPQELGGHQIVYEIQAPYFRVEHNTPSPPFYLGETPNLIHEEEHGIIIAYPQMFIDGRPMTSGSKLRVTIEVLQEEAEDE